MDLRMLMDDKIMFDRYYCINLKKTHQNWENDCALFSTALPPFSYAIRAVAKCFFSWWFEGLARAMRGGPDNWISSRYKLAVKISQHRYLCNNEHY